MVDPFELTPEDIRIGFDRGDFTWWAVSIYGRHQGVVLTEMRAVHRALSIWDVTEVRALRVTETGTKPDNGYSWARTAHAIDMELPSADCLALLAGHGFASLVLASQHAIAHFKANTEAILKSTRDHVDENNRMIEQLLVAANPPPP